MVNPEFDELVQRFRTHASGSSDGNGAGFADSVWRFHHDGPLPEFRRLSTEIESLLEQVVTRRTSWRTEGVPLNLAYAVAEIHSSAARLMLEFLPADAARARGAAYFLWRLACAWEALLAGDVDRIGEHVSLEAASLGVEDPFG